MKRLDKQSLKDFITAELGRYKTEFSNQEFDFAFGRLERVHVISQLYSWRLTFIHLKMLKFAILTFKQI